MAEPPIVTSRPVARAMRELPLAHTCHPAPFRLGAPAYVAALGGSLAVTVLRTAGRRPIR